MNHPGDLLSAYLDGELDSDEHERVAGHLGTCPDCRAELAAASAVRSRVRSLPVLDAPDGLSPAALPAPRRLPAPRPVWAWAAGAVAALALAVGLVLGPGTEPPMDLDTLAERHTARVLVQPGVQTVRAVLEAP